MLDLEMLLRVPKINPDYGLGLSPDGRLFAFSYNTSGQWEIHVLSLDGSGPLRRVTSGPGSKFSPCWSPDGRRLAYVLDLEGGERFDLYVWTPATGEHTNLTPDTADAIQPNYDWSPDGSQIAFISDRSGCFETYVMSSGEETAPTSAPHRVFSIPHPDWEVRWSPDGRWLAVVVEATGQDYATYVIPAAGREASAEAVHLVGYGSQWIPARDAAWSPDSGHLAFASDVDGAFNIGLYDVARGGITWVTTGEGDKEHPTWSADGRQMACTLTDGPLTDLGVVDLATGHIFRHRIGLGIHHRPRFVPNGEHLLTVFDGPDRPADLWRMSVTDGGFDAFGRAQLTHSLPAELQDAPFVLPDQVRYPSLDGTSVPALLYRPRPTGALPPAVLYVHGGPNWLAQITWDPLVQHMVSRGWLVLAPNYRGSTGYGRQWQLANRFDLGGGDTGDVVAGADYLVRQGLADPARVAITGRSYGGYLTMTSLTQYPDRWAAGSAVVPFLNWFTGHANSREDLQHWDLENFGHPERDRDLYHERSPFFFLDRVAAPVQLICGAHDPRCPASESTQAHQALLAQGKRCDLVLYPDEGHSFLKTENVVDAQRRQVGFLAEALERESAS